MNKSYRLIYNEITNTWVAVAETVKGRGKRASGAVVLAAASVVLGIAPAPAFAAPPNPPAPTQLPTGGKVVAGQAGISQSAATLNVNQTSNRAAIDWATFNVGAQAQVNFNQPGVSSVTLNRVLDSNPSQIFGKINANGQVFLTNPNGVYFAPSASADVGALVATTHSISNADFMAGSNTFSRNGATGSVVNDGNLTAALGGYIALLAPEVRNSGVIVAQLGTVALAAGEAFELQFDGNHTLANIQVAPATISALVDNGNAVHAPGGLIILSAQALNHLQGGVIKNTGALEATGLVSDGGRIVLAASDSISHSGSINVDAAANSAGKGGTATLIASLDNSDSVTTVSGSISARGGDLGGDGGFVETSASKVDLSQPHSVTTLAPQGKSGTWLIDPVNITIDSTLASSIQTALGSGSVTITTNGGNTPSTAAGESGTDGDINVNSAISWSANNTLTLTAARNININANLNATGSAGLALTYGASGALNVGMNADRTFKGAVNLASTASYSLNGTAYTIISTADQLQAMGLVGAVAGHYVLGTDILNVGPFTPMYCEFNGASYIGFSGVFDGLGHKVDGVTITDTALDVAPRYPGTYKGFFRYINAAGIVRNFALTNATYISSLFSNAGLLAGQNDGTIANVYVQGRLTPGVNQNSTIGGAVGNNNRNAIISNTHANVAYVNTSNNGVHVVGGLVGRNAGLITDSSSAGSISIDYSNESAGTDFSGIGGLVGLNAASTYYTNGTNFPYDVGGVIKNSTTSTEITTTSSTNTSYSIGGIAGVSNGMNIENSSSTSAISIAGAGQYVGGIVGLFGSTSLVYAPGTLTGNTFSGSINANGITTYAGGIVGYSQGQVASGPTPDRIMTISGNTFSGTMTLASGSNGVGGIVGYVKSYTTVTNNVNTAMPTVGGSALTGSSTGTATGYLGTVLGRNDGTVVSASGNAFVSTPLTYTLSPITGPSYIYNGNAYALSALWTASSIFGPSYNTWASGTDYTFSYGGNTSTDFTNAGTYSGITVNVLKSGFSVAGSGNTTGSLTITPASLSVTANNVNTTYNAAAYAGTPGVTYSGFVTPTGGVRETSALLGGTLAYAYSTASPTNAGNYTITPSGLTSTNYNITHTTGTLTIAQAPLTVTGMTASNKVYDGTVAAVLAGSGTLAGVYAADRANVTLGGTPSGTFGTAGAGTAKPVTVTGFTLSGTAQSNYSVTQPSPSADIAKVTATVSGNSASVTYDGTRQSVSGFTATGLVHGETTSVLTGVSASGSGTNAGSYAVVPTGVDTNYDLTFVNGSLDIGKAAATVTGNSASVTYNGQARSVSGFSASGLVNGETSSVLSGVSASGTGTNAGSYAVAPSGSAANYDLTFVDGNLVIAKAAATVTGNSANVTYNGKSQSASGFTATGLVNGETTSVLSGVSASGSGTNAGSYAVAPAGTDTNYSLTFVNGNLVIAKVAATVTANSANVTYNGKIQSGNGISATGLVNGETASVLSGVSVGGSGTNAGSYVLVPTGTDTNYTLTFVNGNLVIAKAPAIVTGNSASATYNGKSQSASGFTATGLVNGQAASALTGVSASGSGTNAGTYSVVPTGTDANYTLSFVNGNLVIAKAPATITGNSASVTYNGQAQTATGFTATGLVNGQSASVLRGVSASGSGTNAGSYAVVPTGTDANYTLSFVNGNLSVTPAPLTVTANNAAKTYDGLAYQGGNGVAVSGFVNGEGNSLLAGTATYAGNAQGATNAGSYTLSVAGLSAGNNYTLSFVNGQMVISKAHLTVSADDASKIVGSTNPAFTATLSGFVHGETLANSGVSGSVALSSAADNTTPVGTAPIVAKQGTLAAGNYDFTSFKDGTLTINAVYVPPPPPAVQILPNVDTASGPSAVPAPAGTTTSTTASGSTGMADGTTSASATDTSTTRSVAVPATAPVAATGTVLNTGSPGVVVTLARTASATVTGAVTVAVPKDAAATSGFSFGLPADIAGNKNVTTTTVDGGALPGWIKYDAQSNAFVATKVPAGGLPLTVVISSDGIKTSIVISTAIEE